MDQEMRLRIGQNEESWWYPGVPSPVLQNDAELLTSYRRTLGYNRVLIALSSTLLIGLIWRGLK